MGGLPVKPKLQGYVQQELFDEFERFRTTHNLNQSKALEKLLAEYFGKPSAPTLPHEEAIAVATLRADLVKLEQELSQRLQYLEDRLAVRHSSGITVSSAYESAIPLDESAIESAVVEDAIALPATVSVNSSASESAGEPLVGGPAASEPPEEEAVVVEGPAAGESEEVAIAGEPLEPLTSLGLEKRLKKNNSTISRNKDKGNDYFKQWSAELDPDGIAWEFRKGEPRSAQFHPLV